MGAQEAKGQGPGNEEASLCFPGKSPSQVQAQDRTGVVRITALQASSRGWRGQEALWATPRGTFFTLGKGPCINPLLESNSEIGFLTPKLKSRNILKTQRNGTNLGPVISLLGISEKTVQHVEKILCIEVFGVILQ